MAGTVKQQPKKKPMPIAKDRPDTRPDQVPGLYQQIDKGIAKIPKRELADDWLQQVAKSPHAIANPSVMRRAGQKYRARWGMDWKQIK